MGPWTENLVRLGICVSFMKNATVSLDILGKHEMYNFHFKPPPFSYFASDLFKYELVYKVQENFAVDTDLIT